MSPHPRTSVTQETYAQSRWPGATSTARPVAQRLHGELQTKWPVCKGAAWATRLTARNRLPQACGARAAAPATGRARPQPRTDSTFPETMSKRAPRGLGLVLLLHMKCKGKFWMKNRNHQGHSDTRAAVTDSGWLNPLEVSRSPVLRALFGLQSFTHHAARLFLSTQVHHHQNDLRASDPERQKHQPCPRSATLRDGARPTERGLSQELQRPRQHAALRSHTPSTDQAPPHTLPWAGAPLGRGHRFTWPFP